MTSPTSRPLWVGTSWKMNKTLAEADSFVDELLRFPIPSGIQPFLLPAHTALARVRDRLPADSPVLLGAQNAHWAPEGSWTGEISMRMAAGQHPGPKCAPRTSSSLSSLMIDQSTLTSLPNTLYST